MGYGRLVSEPGGSSSRQMLPDPSDQPTTSTPRKSKLKPLIILAAILIVASAISAAVVVALRNKASSHAALHRKPSRAISRTCSKTRYPALCVDSLLDFPGALTASDKDLVHITVNMTLQRLGKALYDVSDIGYVAMDVGSRSAYEDCLELLADSVDLLARSLTTMSPASTEGEGDGSGSSSSSSSSYVGSTQDVLTWLSAALTNQDTCTEGFGEVGGGSVKDQMSEKLKDLTELVSNCLAIYSAAGGDGDDFSGIPIGNKRRRLMGDDEEGYGGNYKQQEEEEEFPKWLSRKDRRLLQVPATSIQADIIVSKDGNGTVKTVGEAIKKAPEHSTRRIIIYVKAGKYEEDNLKVGRKKTNLMFIGDGKGKTVISGGKSIFDKVTTFHTASFAATGAGFIARDMTFENWAGPSKHQAVALRVGADHAVVYRCSIVGYQDTLYVHSQRQFFRECDVYGTVDFIFGNAAVVFQNCTLNARKPMNLQKNTVTAQNRKDPNQNTGISVHACRILATPDLEASKGSFQTYLGRPWKLYSRTVFMLSYMGDHIHPRGFLEWNATFALDTLYYGEYMNYGPGAALGQRVKWPGYRVITTPAEASKFTVAQFIFGSSWLPSTGVAFMAGLST
ncbi:probable pectinesterase/pectinesterase inhibitor 34 [Coffea eugenioides]|uniref:probable pectinesterase/pectinesterase inhibitor 34 n=1 Tax=Coffea eugenioides TaxID=49369 RepID=UPI000F606B0E|nr:probable pectinesterase/pectinesterase inhibitor 34 [Coffea eugenioides]